jgi:Domain of unknown function (DUF4224)
MLRLSPDELVEITGYHQPGKQLEELRRQGFFRARRLVTGEVLLERAHYDAVARGQAENHIGAGATTGPKLRPPRLRAL